MTSSFSITAYPLDPPPLEELVPIISKGLEQNYRYVSVTLTQCPDLTKPPFYLAAPGLCGNESIIDLGGPPYLHPVPDFSKKYSIPSIIAQVSKSENQNEEGRFAIGAAAGPFHVIGQNSELIPNLSISTPRSSNHPTTTAEPELAHIKAYKAAGLDTRGLWSFSQRNKAKALALIEPVPDINQIELFNPREGNSQWFGHEDYILSHCVSGKGQLPIYIKGSWQLPLCYRYIL
jgi:hypothetical protein